MITEHLRDSQETWQINSIHIGISFPPILFLHMRPSRSRHPTVSYTYQQQGNQMSYPTTYTLRVDFPAFFIMIDENFLQSWALFTQGRAWRASRPCHIHSPPLPTAYEGAGSCLPVE
jgi:hypothetical protein